MLKSAALESAAGQPTQPCSPAIWCSIRDGLADLWDWWGDGIHLRPQPRRRARSREFDWHEPHAVEVAREARFRSAPDIRPPPVRVTTIDAHLGEGLCSLTAVVHDALLLEAVEAAPAANDERPHDQEVRRYQQNSPRGVHFAPSGPRTEYFGFYTHRISAAGYRSFPANSFLGAANLRAANLRAANLSAANLRGARVTQSQLDGAFGTDVSLDDALSIPETPPTDEH